MAAKVEFKTAVLLLMPLLLSPLLLSTGIGDMEQSAARMAGTVILLATYWASEALPLPVTAMLPLLLFPVLGIQKNKEVALNYFKDTNILFIGSLMVAAAIEASGLHKRMALRVLLLVGTHERKVLGFAGPVVHGMAFLLLGAMGASWFLSMWISNTASTAMLIPVVRTLLASIKQSAAAAGADGTAVHADGGGGGLSAPQETPVAPAPGAAEGMRSSLTADAESATTADEDPAMTQYGKGLLIGVA